MIVTYFVGTWKLVFHTSTKLFIISKLFLNTERFLWWVLDIRNSRSLLARKRPSEVSFEKKTCITYQIIQGQDKPITIFHLYIICNYSYVKAQIEHLNKWYSQFHMTVNDEVVEYIYNGYPKHSRNQRQVQPKRQRSSNCLKEIDEPFMLIFVHANLVSLIMTWTCKANLQNTLYALFVKNLICSNLQTTLTYLGYCSSTPWQHSDDKIHDKVIDTFRAWLLFLFHLQD